MLCKFLKSFSAKSNLLKNRWSVFSLFFLQLYLEDRFSALTSNDKGKSYSALSTLRVEVVTCYKQIPSSSLPAIENEMCWKGHKAWLPCGCTNNCLNNWRSLILPFGSQTIAAKLKLSRATTMILPSREINRRLRDLTCLDCKNSIILSAIFIKSLINKQWQFIRFKTAWDEVRSNCRPDHETSWSTLRS